MQSSLECFFCGIACNTELPLSPFMNVVHVLSTQISLSPRPMSYLQVAMMTGAKIDELKKLVEEHL